jgi:MFS family permease
MPADSPAPERDPYAAFRSPNYSFYTVGNFVSSFGRQMLGLAIIYEVYQRTHSKTALGLVGLMGALPIVFLSIPGGLASDRWNRKSIIIVTQFIAMLSSVGLMLLALRHLDVPAIPPLDMAVRGLYLLAAWFRESNGVVFEPALPLMYLLLFVNGVTRAFGWAARGALFPNLVPRAALSNAVMWNSGNFEFTCIVGPAVAGLIIARHGVQAIYAIDAICALACLVFVLPIRAPQERPTVHAHPLQDLFSGLHFVRGSQIILATITLDLFAVLLGGATALLPIFAEEILHVGAVGLGWLRAAPSIGAVLMAVILAHRPPLRRAGLAMLYAVFGFGLATVVFGLSQVFWLAFVALLCTGLCDNVSVVVRHTLVQLLTPDSMRGRVSAVNNIFIGSSNELGALESGLTAAAFGPVLSVVGGGVGTILVVLATALQWPALRRLGPLHTVEKVGERETTD